MSARPCTCNGVWANAYKCPVHSWPLAPAPDGPPEPDPLLSRIRTMAREIGDNRGGDVIIEAVAALRSQVAERDRDFERWTEDYTGQIDPSKMLADINILRHEQADLSRRLTEATAEVERWQDEAVKAQERAERHREGEKDALERLTEATEALDEWAPLNEGEAKTLAERIRDEGKDFGMLADHLSRTYMHFSGGRISKPNTYPDEVFSVADDLQQREWEKYLAEETAEIQARLTEAEARADKLLIPFRDGWLWVKRYPTQLRPDLGDVEWKVLAVEPSYGLALWFANPSAPPAERTEEA